MAFNQSRPTSPMGLGLTSAPPSPLLGYQPHEELAPQVDLGTPTPVAQALANDMNPAVAAILGSAQNTALVAMGLSHLTTPVQTSAPPPDLEAQKQQKYRMARSAMRKAIFDDETFQFISREQLSGPEVTYIKEDAWTGYRGKPYDVVERSQIRNYLYGKYRPTVEVPELTFVDQPMDELIAANYTGARYKQILKEIRDYGIAPHAAPALPQPTHERRRTVKSKPRAAAKPQPMEELEYVDLTAEDGEEHEQEKRTEPDQPMMAEEEEPEQKKPRVSINIRLPAPEQPPVEPSPKVVAPPPPTPTVATPAPALADDTQDRIGIALRAAMEGARRTADAAATRLAHSTAQVAQAQAAFESAQAALQEAQIEYSIVSHEVEKANTVASEAAAKFKTHEENKVCCVACKKFAGTRPILLTMTCGHVSCAACFEKVVSDSVELAKRTDAPVMCPGCVGASAGAPQHCAYNKEAARLLPAAAKGFIDPFVLSMGKLDEALVHAVALQQLAFPEFIAEPVPAGTRPTRVFCPKCNTPTYGLSNIEMWAARCTNPHCAALYCCKCSAHTFHIGKKCC